MNQQVLRNTSSLRLSGQPASMKGHGAASLRVAAQTCSLADRLVGALTQTTGIFLVTGAMGMGKTGFARFLACRLQELGHPVLQSHIGGGAQPEDTLRLARAAIERPGGGRPPVLVRDDAHLLSTEALLAIAHLLNPEIESRLGLRVVLIGRPILRERLFHPDLAAVKARVRFSDRLRPSDRLTMPPVRLPETRRDTEPVSKDHAPAAATIISRRTRTDGSAPEKPSQPDETPKQERAAPSTPPCVQPETDLADALPAPPMTDSARTADVPGASEMPTRVEPELPVRKPQSPTRAAPSTSPHVQPDTDLADALPAPLMTPPRTQTSQKRRLGPTALAMVAAGLALVIAPTTLRTPAPPQDQTAPGVAHMEDPLAAAPDSKAAPVAQVPPSPAVAEEQPKATASPLPPEVESSAQQAEATPAPAQAAEVAARLRAAPAPPQDPPPRAAAPQPAKKPPARYAAKPASAAVRRSKANAPTAEPSPQPPEQVAAIAPPLPAPAPAPVAATPVPEDVPPAPVQVANTASEPSASRPAASGTTCEPYTADGTFAGRGTTVRGLACRDAAGRWWLVNQTKE